MIMWAFAVALLVAYVAATRRRARISYETFALTLPSSRARLTKFLRHHPKSIPLHLVYGKDTKKVEIAREFEDYVEPKKWKHALAMHYNPNLRRPDITYFNLGAIGAWMGHVEVWRRAKARGTKYALVFEDNVAPSERLYHEVERVIQEKGDSFEAVFFHCIARVTDGREGTLERVKWISSMKCYLVNVPNFLPFVEKHMFRMDNHVDNKMEDLIANGARVFYKDMGHCAKIDRSGPSTIGHADHDKPEWFSDRFTFDQLTHGTW